MNPAALKANIGDVPRGGDLIVDTHDFTERALARVGWSANPLEDGSLDLETAPGPADLADGQVRWKPSTSRRKDAERSKNMFALGLLSWMYARPTEGTLNS